MSLEEIYERINFIFKIEDFTMRDFYHAMSAEEISKLGVHSMALEGSQEFMEEMLLNEYPIEELKKLSQEPFYSPIKKSQIVKKYINCLKIYKNITNKIVMIEIGPMDSKPPIDDTQFNMNFDIKKITSETFQVDQIVTMCLENKNVFNNETLFIYCNKSKKQIDLFLKSSILDNCEEILKDYKQTYDVNELNSNEYKIKI